MIDDEVMSVAVAAFGKKLRTLRTARGWSQQQLANELDMGIAQIARYERGLSQPTLEVIKKAAVIFRVTSDELIFEQGAAGAAESLLKGDLLKRFEQLAHLPEEDQRAVLYLIDAVLARAEFAAVAARQIGPRLAR
jgi:transcriptional regulator with XRE-family HTH domain